MHKLRRVLCDEVDPYPTRQSSDPVPMIGRRGRLKTIQEATMRLREKGRDEVVHLGWDEAQAALQAGTHVAADADGSGSEKAREGDVDGSADLDGKTREELDALAKERSVDISKAKNKADVIEALRAGR